MIASATLLWPALLTAGAARQPAATAPDTLRLEVGSPEVDLGSMRPHEARVQVERLAGESWQPVVEWTNRLEVGDSGGRAVHRWTTIGRRPAASSGPSAWELYQTFDRTSIAPLGLYRTGSDGVEVRLTIEGPLIRGTRRAAAGAPSSPVDITLSRAAFPAAASDLVPMGVRLRPGLVMTAPVWQMGMPDAETRVFDVVGRRELPVAGKTWNTWVVEERALRGRGVVFIGTWYLVEEPPYMVYAEVVGPGGSKQRMTEVLVRAR
jgi:hypothetical protein